MTDNRIYSVIINTDKTWFYGTFSNRKNMLDSLKMNIDLTGAYIQGSTKKLDITPVTIFNGFIKNGLTIYKDDKKGQQQWFIKVIMHQMNNINPYFTFNKKQTSLF